MQSFELGEEAVRILARMVHDYRAGKLGGSPAARPGRRQENYRPLWYRLLTDETEGEYTARKQAWDDTASEFVDVADEDDPEYNLDVDGYDYLGRDGATVGAAGTGRIVPAWKIVVDGEWVTLIDVGAEDEKVRVSSCDETSGFLRLTAGDDQADHKIIGDSETDICGSAPGYWIECEIVTDANGEQQLKIDHVGPGESCYYWEGCGWCCDAVTGFDLDGVGQVRKLQYNYSTWAGPCA